MFVIFIEQVISERNDGLLMGIRGGFPRQRCDAPDVGETPLLTHQQKLFCSSNRAKYLEHPYTYLYSKNHHEVPIFRGESKGLKIRPIGLALGRQYVCPQPRWDSPFPVVSRELLRLPIGMEKPKVKSYHATFPRSLLISNLIRGDIKIQWLQNIYSAASCSQLI